MILAERKARLSALSFVWDPFTDQWQEGLRHLQGILDARGSVWDALAEWDEGFQHLQAFVNEHGHCRVPFSHIAADRFRLGGWGRQAASDPKQDAPRTKGAARGS
jgi:Helicase associated domain